MSHITNSSSGIDQLVRDYLLAKGYTKALEAMESAEQQKKQRSDEAYTPVYIEGRNLLPSASSSSGGSKPLDGDDLDGAKTGKTTVESLLSNAATSLYVIGIKEGDPNVFLEEYGQFHHWTSQSIDIVSPYLEAIGFVVFITCHIGLIRQGHLSEAHRLWALYSQKYTHMFPEELQYVALLQNSSQLSDQRFLSTNPFMQSVLKEKFIIQISNLSFSLLSHYLAENDLVLIAAIINDKIEFEKSKFHETYPNIDSNELLFVKGYSPSGAKNTGSTELELGVPGTGDVLRDLQAKSGLYDSITIPAASKLNDYYKIWMPRLVRPRSILEKSKRRRIDGEDNFTSLIINTERSIGDEGNSLEPSVIFATIGNTNEGLNCMNINDDVSQVVTGHNDSIVRVWKLNQTENDPNLSFGKSLRDYAGKVKWEFDDIRPKLPHAFNNGDGAMDVEDSGENRLFNSSGSSRYPMLEFVGHDLPVFAVDQTSSGRLLASSSADETIRLWDTSVIQCVSKIRCSSVAWDLKFHPFDFYFATAHANRSVSIYATDQLTPLRLMTGHSSDVTCLTWHSNALHLASGSDDRSVRFWDIRTAECARLFRGCGSPVSSLAISPIGNLIAAGADSGNIYLWDIRSSKQLGILHGHEGPAYSIAFNNNGTVLSSGGKDCSLRIWDLSPALFPGYNDAATSSLEKGPYRLIRPRHSFFTKASPVYHVGMTKMNLVYAGGPCSLDAATYGASGFGKDMSNGISSERELTKLMNIKGVKPVN